MEFIANENKQVEIEINGKHYLRHAVHTHFVKQGENYLDIFRQYILPIYEKGDIVSCNEKIIALCQNRVVKREDITIDFWARLLSRFASHPDTGVGVGETIKMQYAIDKVGLFKVLYASAASAVTKLFGKKGVFYEIVGQELLGHSNGIPLSEQEMLGLIRDNPAGQGRQCTPLILIREKAIENKMPV